MRVCPYYLNLTNIIYILNYFNIRYINYISISINLVSIIFILINQFQMGEDPTREGLLDTPKRAAKALIYFTHGYDLTISQVVKVGFVR